RRRELPETIHELGGSVCPLVRVATNKEKPQRRAGPKSSSANVPDVEVCANQILLPMADRKVCRTIVNPSPITGILLFEEVSRTERFGVPVDIFGRNLVSEALNNRDSFLFTEPEGHEAGVLRFKSPRTHEIAARQ